MGLILFHQSKCAFLIKPRIQSRPCSIDTEVQEGMDIDIPMAGTPDFQFEEIRHNISVGFKKANLCRGTTHFNHTVAVWVVV